jgi:hypothetical protein
MAGRSVSRAWTESAIKELRTLAGKQSTAQIAVELERTTAGIIQKAFDLRLSLRVRLRDEAKAPAEDPAPDCH